MKRVKGNRSHREIHLDLFKLLMMLIRSNLFRNPKLDLECLQSLSLAIFLKRLMRFIRSNRTCIPKRNRQTSLMMILL